MKRTSWLGPVCWLFGAALGLGLGMSTSAKAGIVITGTRVIYLSNEREVTVRVQNDSDHPALVQTWLDSGNTAAQPATEKVPFIVTPPLFRMESQQGQSLRIIHTGEPLAQDKETVFWLSVLELPPKRAATESDENTLQMAFRTRVKLFYRPVALNQPEAISKAWDKLQWKLTLRADGKVTLVASNASPYYITAVNVVLKIGERSVETEDGAMAGPGGTATFVLNNLSAMPATADLKVKYDLINDFGAMTPRENSVGK